MNEKQFSELSVGDRFSYNGVEYIKTQEVRISCCRSVNCQAVNDPNHKTFVSGTALVNING